MSNTMEYKGYVGNVEFSERDGVFFGKVLGIRALLSYEGTTAQELIEDFHSVVDDYLELCSNQGIEPEKSYKGSFNIRISPDLHKKVAVYALSNQVSLNSVVEEALLNYVAEKLNI